MFHGSLNSHGFSLTELVIALALLAVLLLGGATLLNTQNMLTGNLQLQTARDSLRGVLIRTFANPVTCGPALTKAPHVTVFNPSKAGIPPLPPGGAFGMPLNITLDQGATIILSGDPSGPTPPINLPNYDLAYEYVVFRNAIKIGADQNPLYPGNILYEGAVVMKTDKPNGTNNIITGVGMALLTVGNITLSVNPTTNAISACQTSFSVNSACSNFGGGPPNASAQCSSVSPCAVGELFLGNDATGAPICHTPCTVAGTALVLNNLGALICATP